MTAQIYTIKVRKPGEKRAYRLNHNYGLVTLRTNAAMIQDKDKAERIARELQEDYPEHTIWAERF